MIGAPLEIDWALGGCGGIDRGAQRLQPATDARAGGVLADVERSRERLVALFLDDTQTDCFTLIDRQSVQLLGNAVAQLARSSELLDALVLDVGQRAALDPKTRQSTSLRAISPEMVGQLVAGDAIQPRASGSFAATATEAMTALERYSERLGQDVHRYLRIPGAADQER
jgi:hypothetical protein